MKVVLPPDPPKPFAEIRKEVIVRKLVKRFEEWVRKNEEKQ